MKVDTDRTPATSERYNNVGQAPLTIALPKGRLLVEAVQLLARANLSYDDDQGGRKLILTDATGDLRYILAKPADVPIYVEHGAADLGICGLDILRESRREVYEPLLLPFGYCRLSLAGREPQTDVPMRHLSQPRVATTFPYLTSQFFGKRGVNAEIIPLHGSVELGPLVGLADLIVDLVQTGNTLRANGLVELRVIMHSQAVLIANRSSYRVKATYVERVIDAIRVAIGRDDSTGDLSASEQSVPNPKQADDLQAADMVGANKSEDAR